MPPPGAAIDVGLKLVVTPGGRPLASRLMAEAKPFSTLALIVETPLPAPVTVMEVGEVTNVKLAGAAGAAGGVDAATWADDEAIEVAPQFDALGARAKPHTTAQSQTRFGT